MATPTIPFPPPGTLNWYLLAYGLPILGLLFATFHKILEFADKRRDLSSGKSPENGAVEAGQRETQAGIVSIHNDIRRIGDCIKDNHEAIREAEKEILGEINDVRKEVVDVYKLVARKEH